MPIRADRLSVLLRDESATKGKYMKQDDASSYPLFRAYLSIKGLALKPAYTVHEVAGIFEVSARTIQSWVADGRLNSRNIPGRAKILPADIEALLSVSERDR